VPEYIYHIKPDKMVGKSLVPLSELKDLSPDLHKQHTSNRNKKIKLLDCNWDDVLFMSCLNPIVICSALQLFGLYDRGKKPTKIFRFPIKVLNDSEFCFYQETKKSESFKPMTVKKYEEEHDFPHETATYFLECAKKDEDPLIFSNIPHLLVKSSLDIKLADIIEYQPFLV
jgi:hypothetical protein